MKMTTEQFTGLKTACETVLKANPGIVEKYEVGQFRHADRVNCLQTRFCFDVFGAVMRAGLINVTEYYKTLNDDHILTALNRICPTVTRRY